MGDMADAIDAAYPRDEVTPQRSVRDRLGEALRARDLEEWGGPPRPWASENGTTKHRYRAMADDFIALAASCGLKIVLDDGEQTP